MHSRLAHIAVVIALVLAGFTAVAILIDQSDSPQVEIDQEVPPGNPVVGSDAPGDFEPNGANYELLAIIAVGLIVSGALLVKLERWERRRSADPTPS